MPFGAQAVRARFSNKVVLVFGAGSVLPGWGNGKAATISFAREGAKVFATDMSPKALDGTRSAFEAEGLDCASALCDVGDPLQMEDVVNQCLAKYGRIDVLYYNVGISRNGGGITQKPEDWDLILKVNLSGLFHACRLVLPQMKRAGGGSIVAVSSVVAKRWLGKANIAYAASKAGLFGYIQALAQEFAVDNIRANVVTPGMIDTPTTTRIAEAYGGDIELMRRDRAAAVPMKRQGEAWDIANAVLFLASGEAKYITGVEIVVDGGLTGQVGNRLPSAGTIGH